MDRETTAQEKCFQILEDVLISNIVPQSKLVKTTFFGVSFSEMSKTTAHQTQPTEQAPFFHIFQVSSRGYGAQNMLSGGGWIIFSVPSTVAHVWSCTSTSYSSQKNTKYYPLFGSLLEPTPRTQCTIVQCDLDVMFTLIILCCNHCLDQLISAIFLHGIYWIKLPALQDKKLGKH